MNSRTDTRWTPWNPAHEDGHESAGSARAEARAPKHASAAPPAAYFISVLEELATGEKLGNDERLRAVAMLESQFGEGRPWRGPAAHAQGSGAHLRGGHRFVHVAAYGARR